MAVKESTIRDAILRLDAGDFQNFAQELATRAYGFKNPVHLGSHGYSSKTVSGSPDTYWILPEGQYAFLEIGHVTDRAEAREKIRDDILRCLKVERQQLDTGCLRLILVAYSCRRLLPGDMKELRDIDGRVELLGVDKMASLVANTYPALGEEYLGITVSSGQILTVGEFEDKVDCSEFAASLKVDLVGRESDLSALLESMENSRFVLLSGKPGAGKTRVAVEAVRRYSNEHDCPSYVISSNRLSIWNDLNNEISGADECAVLVDDGNELTQLEAFADYVSRHDGVHVIMTVRDYAREGVAQAVQKHINISGYVLAPLSDADMERIVVESFAVRPGAPASSIVQAVHGNVRLAYSASMLAKQKGVEAFAKMSDLVNACYRDAVNVLDVRQVNAAKIIAILGAHETGGNSDLNILLEHFGLTPREYRQACMELHDNELADVCRGFTAVSLGDQVLRDYLLFRVFCMDFDLELADVVELDCGERRCARIAEILASSYYSPEVIDILKRQVRSIWDTADGEKRWSMARTYGYLLENEALLLAKSSIDSLPEVHIDYLVAVAIGKKPSHYHFEFRHLGVLVSFLHHGPFGDAEELFFRSLLRNNSAVDDYRALLTSNMGFNDSSYSLEFAYEHAVLEKLVELWRATGDTTFAVLLVEYASVLLAPYFEGPAFMSGNKVTFLHGDLVYSDALIELRKEAVGYLWSLRQDVRFVDFADSVIAGLRGGGGIRQNKLWTETMNLAYEMYVSRIAELHPRMIPGFVHFEKLAIAAGVCEGEGLSCLRTGSDTKALAFLFRHAWDYELDEATCEEEFSSVGFDQIAEILKQASEIASASSEGFPYQSARKVVDYCLHSRNDEVMSSPEKLICPGLAGRILSPELVKGWLDDKGAARLRDLARDLPMNERRFVFRMIDEERALSKVTQFLADDVIKDAAELGETIDFSTAVRIDERVPGFFIEYSRAVLSSCDVGASRLVDLLPNLGALFTLSDFCARPDVIEQIEAALLKMVAGEQTSWSAELLEFILKRDRDFACRAAQVLVSNEAAEALKAFGEACWSLDDREEVSSIVFMSMKDLSPQLLDFEFAHQLFYYLDSALSCDPDTAGRWLVQVSIEEDGSLFLPAASVGMKLPVEARIDYVVRLCDAGLDVEEFEKIPFDISMLGESWSGSHIPLIDAKIDFIIRLAGRLAGVDNMGYRAVLEKEERRLRDRRQREEVWEFVSPY